MSLDDTDYFKDDNQNIEFGKYDSYESEIDYVCVIEFIIILTLIYFGYILLS